MSKETSWDHLALAWAKAIDENADPFRRFCLDPFLERYLSGLPGGAWLDLGCGEGASSRALQRPDRQVTGIENNPSMAALAGERSPGVDIQVADATRLPFRDGQFSGVLSKLGTVGIPVYADVVREAARVMAPGGIFVDAMPHPCFHRGATSPESLDTYLSERGYPVVFSFLESAGNHSVDNYHRSLERIASDVGEAGLVITALHEPRPAEGLLESPAWKVSGGTGPPFLILECRKPSV